MSRFIAKQTKMVVGVAFDENNDLFLAKAMTLAKHLQIHVHLTHVCQTWADSPLMVSFPAGYYSYSVASSIDKEELELAEEKLRDISAKWRSEGLSVSSNVVFGSIHQGLISEAQSERATLIVSGTNFSNESLVWRGLSSAINLIRDSKIPVLIIPHDAPIMMNKKSLSLLVCDDLSRGSDTILEIAEDFATTIGDAQFIHAHIADFEVKELKRIGAKILQAMTLGNIPYDKKFNQDQLVIGAKEEILSKMTQRILPYKSLSESRGTTYQQIVRTGDVGSELTKLVAEKEIDFIFFGHHEFLHNDPLHLGKVPFNVMLSLKKPLLVAADQKKLR